MVALSGDRLLLRRRPDGGLLAGMWEFPGRELAGGADPTDVAAGLTKDLLGVAVEPGALRWLEAVPHVFSHRRETYHPFLVRLSEAAAPRADDLTWVVRPELRRHARPRAQRRIQSRALSA